MVKNIWSSIRLFCGNHEDNHSIEMIPHEGADGLDMFYSCPKYYPENRSAEERPCGNRINLVEYQAAVEHISEVLEEAQLDGGTVNLRGHKWKNKKGIRFEVINHSMNHIDISFVNERALRN